MSKTRPSGTVLSFLLFIYMVRVKNKANKTKWSNLVIIWHKWSLYDPLPKMFNLFGPSKIKATGGGVSVCVCVCGGGGG